MSQAAERYTRVRELFLATVDVPHAERAAVLERQCADDAVLREEVEALLEADAHADSLDEQPPFAIPLEVFDDGEEEQIAGRHFGPYEIVREIGRGGLGSVYLAFRFDGEYRKEVALKLIRRGLDTDDILRRFRNERQILAQLDHPNIARLIDGGTTDDGLPYFVMEYVKGEPITTYCDLRKLSTAERLGLFCKVCAAVTYAHQNLVIHRDLKPSNILVTDEGEPKLLDFGIAKLLTTDDEIMLTQTAPGLRPMTPDYASPEQIKGARITTASDVYSLGVLLYELLTGQKPYRLKTRTSDAIARAITDQEPERPSTAVAPATSDGNSPTDLRKSLRGDLDNIVLMAMRKEPERRYVSVAQFSGDIRRHLEGLPLIAHKDTASYRLSKFIRRHRLGVSAAALIMSAIVTGLLVALWQAENARQQRDLAERERVAAERLNLFLQRMLSFSNQSITSVWPVTQKRDVTVNEMLDQIAPQVETELAGQPAFRAQVLRTIGNAYASQGQYDSAEKSLRGALEVQAQLSGRENSEAAAAMADLGILLFRQAKLEEANEVLERAVALCRKQRQENSTAYSAARFALSLDYLGVVKFYRGETDVPRSLLREALAVSSGANLQGTERRVVTFNKSDLGALLVVTGESEQGEPLLREAAAEYRQMLPQPPWELGSTLRFLGIAALQKNQPDEAEKYLLEGEQVLRRTLGDQNSYLALTLDRQAAALLLKNDLGPAEEKARAALAMFQAISPANKLPWAPALWTLGDILAKDGRNIEGEDCYRQALAIHEGQPNKNHLFLTTSKIRLSQFLLAQKRFPEAERVASEAHSGAVENLGSESPVTRTATSNLIQVHETLGKGDLAQDLK